jgi:hypothetical protein
VRQTIAQYVQKEYGFGARASHIYMTAGAAASLTIALTAIVEDGDEVIAIAPYFPEYRVFTEKTGAKFVPVPSKEKTFQLDLNLPVCESLSSINNYYQAMRDDLQATYALNREDAARQLADYQAAGLEFLPWTAQVTATVTRNDGVTLSVLREVYENFGSPYPTVFYQAETFDVASQGRLVLGNLFTVNEEDAVKRLMDEVRAMALQTDSIHWYEGVADRLEQLYDPLDFALTDDSLVVFFRDIAPHAAGVQRFEIPLSALSDILKPQWVN